MIDYNKHYEEMIMFCDGGLCDKTLELQGEWVECIQQAKDKKWRLREIDGVWEHYCPKCWSNLNTKDAFEDVK